MNKKISNIKTKVAYNVVKAEVALLNKLGLNVGCCDLAVNHSDVIWVECNDGKAVMKVYPYEEIKKNIMC